MKQIIFFSDDVTVEMLNDYLTYLKKQLKDVENKILLGRLITFDDIMVNKLSLKMKNDPQLDYLDFQKLKALKERYFQKSDFSDMYEVRNQIETLIESVFMEICRREFD